MTLRFRAHHHVLSGPYDNICMKKITVNQQQFELEAGESVLDGLLRTGHPVEYQCKNGYCGACSCRLLSGQVTYSTPPLAYIPAGQILTCCCKPQTDLTLELDTSTPDNVSSV